MKSTHLLGVVFIAALLGACSEKKVTSSALLQHEQQIDSLIMQMTLEEKAGLLFINGSVINEDGTLEAKQGEPGFGRAALDQMLNQKMNHFNLWRVPGVGVTAAWHNKLQRAAEQTQGRLCGEHRHHQTHQQRADEDHVRRSRENPRGMLGDDHVFAEEFDDVEAGLPDSRPAAILQPGFPILDTAAHQRRQHKQHQHLQDHGDGVEVHSANISSNSSVMKM